jgi:hypothetical protein
MFRGAGAVLPEEGTGFSAAATWSPPGFDFTFDGFLFADGMVRSSLVLLDDL